MSETTEAPTERDETRDALALSGLRRMVLHARDKLSGAMEQPTGWQYSSDRWDAATVRRHAAMTLAEQVLTLVAECIPGGGTISLDEAEAAARSAAEAAARRDRQRAAAAAALQEQVTKLQGQIELLVKERDDAREQWGLSEGAEAELLDKLERVTALARTDVPAAVKLLLEED